MQINSIDINKNIADISGRINKALSNTYVLENLIKNYGTIYKYSYIDSLLNKIKNISSLRETLLAPGYSVSNVPDKITLPDPLFKSEDEFVDYVVDRSNNVYTYEYKINIQSTINCNCLSFTNTSAFPYKLVSIGGVAVNKENLFGLSTVYFNDMNLTDKVMLTFELSQSFKTNMESSMFEAMKSRGSLEMKQISALTNNYVFNVFNFAIKDISLYKLNQTSNIKNSYDFGKKVNQIKISINDNSLERAYKVNDINILNSNNAVFSGELYEETVTNKLSFPAESVKLTDNSVVAIPDLYTTPFTAETKVKYTPLFIKHNTPVAISRPIVSRTVILNKDQFFQKMYNDNGTQKNMYAMRLSENINFTALPNSVIVEKNNVSYPYLANKRIIIDDSYIYISPQVLNDLSKGDQYLVKYSTIYNNDSNVPLYMPDGSIKFPSKTKINTLSVIKKTISNIAENINMWYK